MNQYKSAPQMRRRTDAHRPPVRQRARRRRIRNFAVIRWLVFFWPMGMLLMWNPACRWKRINKLAVSIGSAAIIAILVTGMLGVVQQNQRTSGGVRLVSVNPHVEVYGPPAPASVKYSFDTTNIPQAELVTAEPTEIPEMGFWNEGGKYFHTENCRYTTTKSQPFYVPYLLKHGFKPCKECQANELAAPYLGE